MPSIPPDLYRDTTAIQCAGNTVLIDIAAEIFQLNRAHPIARDRQIHPLPLRQAHRYIPAGIRQVKIFAHRFHIDIDISPAGRCRQTTGNIT